jgi:type I restriction-modification system DNA methylase subunit
MCSGFRKGARWDSQAKSADIGEPINNAMDAVMKTNPSLTGVLPKIFNRDDGGQRRLGELVDLISDARFTGHGEKKARDASAVYGQEPNERTWRLAKMNLAIHGINSDDEGRPVNQPADGVESLPSSC